MKEVLQRKPKNDLSGLKFNMLTVVNRVYINGKPLWHCICDCGNEVNVRHTHLMEGQKSCGCYANKLLGDRKRKHGKRHSKLYPIWVAIKMRCENPNNTAYKNYGARGITVCDEWKNNFGSFYEWSIRNGYDENAKFMRCTIDRIDNNGNYEPGNCRWISMKKQCNNRRSNIFLEYNNEKHTVAEWSEIIGVSCPVLYARIKKGWSVGEVLGFEYKRERRIQNEKKYYAM